MRPTAKHGAATPASSRLPQGSPLDRAATASRILRSAQRMGRMIKDLLDFTRIRLGGWSARESAAAPAVIALSGPRRSWLRMPMNWSR